tara:strand:+ start:621 stop:1358 length:738 start_codon:yes stop_codon:yes gene_type:complete
MKIKKIILVLGSEGSVGKPLVNTLLKKNYSVIAVDNKFIKETRRTNYYYIKSDVTKKNNLKNLFIKINKIGKLYAAINCLYPRTKTWGTKFESLDTSKIQDHLYFQLGLPILISKEICKHFLNSGSGKLINISSIQGISAPKFDHYKNTKMISPIEYSIAKSGIISLTKYLAKYYKGKKILVNCVSPGGIKLNQPLNFKKKYNKACNSKGLLDGIDIVNTIMFLISEKSNFITGQNIIIDDGWSL